MKTEAEGHLKVLLDVCTEEAAGDKGCNKAALDAGKTKTGIFS